MFKKLFVGNLAFQITESEIRDTFGKFGSVVSVNLITDRFSGRSKGFAFVEMEASDAEKAIAGLSGRELLGRALTVNVANPPIRRRNTEERSYTVGLARQHRH